MTNQSAPKPAAPAFTPGPWIVFIEGGEEVRRFDSREAADSFVEHAAEVAPDCSCDGFPLSYAASAPDLLAACEAAMRAMREVRDSDPGYGGIVLRPSWTDAWDAIGAALRRARGEGDQK